QVLPVTNPDRPGECQALRPERLLGELQTVQRVILHAEAIVEWNLPLERGTAIIDHSGDAFAVLRLQPPHPQGSQAVEHPDLERLALDSRGRAVIDDRRSVLDRDDAGVREGTAG